MNTLKPISAKKSVLFFLAALAWLLCWPGCGHLVVEPVLLPQDGLMAYYPFNGNADDESEKTNSGNVHGAEPTADRFGRQGLLF
jgi:hypothetical protein